MDPRADPAVTDEMVEAFSQNYWGEGWSDAWDTRAGRLRAALTAAFVPLAEKAERERGEANYHFNAYVAVTDARIDALTADNAALREALTLAVDMVMVHEPGDSRAVSGEAVALAAVACDCANDECWEIIRSANAARTALAQAGKTEERGG